MKFYAVTKAIRNLFPLRPLDHNSLFLSHVSYSRNACTGRPIPTVGLITGAKNNREGFGSNKF